MWFFILVHFAHKIIAEILTPFYYFSQDGQATEWNLHHPRGDQSCCDSNEEKFSMGESHTTGLQICSLGTLSCEEFSSNVYEITQEVRKTRHWLTLVTSLLDLTLLKTFNDQSICPMSGYSSLVQNLISLPLVLSDSNLPIKYLWVNNVHWP